MQVLYDNIAIEKSEKITKTESGIILTPESSERTSIGTVIMAGPGAVDPVSHEFVPTTVKPGDRVLFAKNNVVDVKVDDKELSFITERDIFCILNK